jgi:hypothetical protein
VPNSVSAAVFASVGASTSTSATAATTTNMRAGIRCGVTGRVFSSTVLPMDAPATTTNTAIEDQRKRSPSTARRDEVAVRCGAVRCGAVRWLVRHSR